MEQVRKWLTLLLQVVIVALILWFWFDRKEQDTLVKEYWENPNFKTDSIKAVIEYDKLPVPIYKNYIPPAVVVEYKAPAINNKISLNLNDSLLTVIDSLKNQIYTISALYLKLYPNASKLIYGSFSSDTIQLDLLNTEGRIFTSKIAVNFLRFKYQYQDGVFRGEEVRLDSRKTSSNRAVYGYAGYDLISGEPLLGIDASIHKRKFRLSANSFLTIEEQPRWAIQTSIGYRLYGN